MNELNKSNILQEILRLAKSELNETGSIGYTMPDGKHHIYIYVDDSIQYADDEKTVDDGFYVIEPNRVVDGAHEPMGDTTAADYNNFAELLVGCMWCIDQFEHDFDFNHTQDLTITSIETLSEVITAVANRAIEITVDKTTSGNRYVAYDDVSDLISKSDYLKYFDLIVDEVYSHEELLDLNITDNHELDINCGLAWCKNYEPLPEEGYEFGKDYGYEDFVPKPSLTQLANSKNNIVPEKQVVVDLGFASLTAVKGSDPDYKEVFIGLTDKDGVWLQDLAMIGQNYRYVDDEIIFDEELSIKVYSDKDNEDYTHDFTVGLYEDPDLSPLVPSDNAKAIADGKPSLDSLIDNATPKQPRPNAKNNNEYHR